MGSESRELVNLRVQHRETQSCGKLLATTHRGLVKEVKGKTPYRPVLFQTGAQSADAEICERTSPQNQAANGGKT